MTISRRKFVRVLGSGAAVVAAGGVGLARCDRMPADAVKGWSAPGRGETDPRRRALSFALLAPNPHNMQSWAVDLSGEDEIALHVDTTRLLPETDPYARQIVIGQGTFLEVLAIAASAEGFSADITYFPDGAPAAHDIGARPIARIKLRKTGVAPDPLFAQISHRRSAKVPYLEKPLQPDHMTALQSSHGSSTVALEMTRQPDDVATLKDITWEAMVTEMRTPRALRETLERTRVSADAITRHRDGISLHGPFFWWTKRLGLFTPDKAATPGTFAFDAGLDYVSNWYGTARAFGWMTTATNSRIDQIEAGRAYVRFNLKATELGVAMHPFSQVLQEYREMQSLQRSFLKAVAAPAGSTVQMLFRLGYADLPDPTPRRWLGDIVKNA